VTHATTTRRRPDDDQETTGEPMTDNPFEGLGGAGASTPGLLQQAQQMQEQLESAQERLADARSTVRRWRRGHRHRERHRRAPGRHHQAGTFDGSSDDDLSDLGDLVVAAYRDAKARRTTSPAAPRTTLAGGMPGLGGPGLDAGPGALGNSWRRDLTCTKESSRT
jgi:DNA-binding protein YbaB